MAGRGMRGLEGGVGRNEKGGVEKVAERERAKVREVRSGRGRGSASGGGGARECEDEGRRGWVNMRIGTTRVES
eukprot:2446452-Pleurochrysis_carterae.AAC.6